MNVESYAIFLAASFLLWITPGQDTIYVITRSITQGRSAGIVSALGVGTGGLVHAALATAGVSLVILTSPILFLTVKIFGGLYLVYLGVSVFLSHSASSAVPAVETGKLTKIYSQGVITSVLNPKVALFFIAFLPQFVSSGAPVSDLATLGLIFVAGGTAWCLVVAYFAASLAATIYPHNFVKNWFHKLSGAIYITLGFNVLRAKV